MRVSDLGRASRHVPGPGPYRVSPIRAQPPFLGALRLQPARLVPGIRLSGGLSRESETSPRVLPLRLSQGSVELILEDEIPSRPSTETAPLLRKRGGSGPGPARVAAIPDT